MLAGVYLAAVLVIAGMPAYLARRIADDLYAKVFWIIVSGCGGFVLGIVAAGAAQPFYVQATGDVLSPDWTSRCAVFGPLIGWWLGKPIAPPPSPQEDRKA